MEAIEFGDVEAAVIAHLKPLIKPATIDTEIPETRPDQFVTVKRGGGARRGLVIDSANIEFEAFATKRADAWALVSKVRAHVGALKGQTIGGMTVYAVEEFTGPAYLQHPIADQHRYVYTVALDMRYPR